MTETPIERVEKKVDRLTELFTEVAVQKKDIEHLGVRVDDHGGRLKKIENKPGQVLWAICLVVFSCLASYVGYSIRG